MTQLIEANSINLQYTKDKKIIEKFFIDTKLLKNQDKQQIEKLSIIEEDRRKIFVIDTNSFIGEGYYYIQRKKKSEIINQIAILQHDTTTVYKYSIHTKEEKINKLSRCKIIGKVIGVYTNEIRNYCA